MQKEIEVWLPVKDYEGLYEISSWGNVRSLDRKIGARTIKGTMMKPTLRVGKNAGYRTVKLSKDGKKQKLRIGRLVASHFIENPENKPDVNHIDHDRRNDYYKNLEWVTPRENALHGYRNNKENYTGIDKQKSGKFRARIFYKGKSKPLGTYDTPEEAHRAYLNALKEIGESSRYV